MAGGWSFCASCDSWPMPEFKAVQPQLIVWTWPIAPSQIHSQNRRMVSNEWPWLPSWVTTLCSLAAFIRLADLADRMGQRLLAVDVLAAIDGGHRRHGVVVVGRADEDPVDILLHLVQHLAEIAELLGLGIPGQGLAGVTPIDVAQGDDVGAISCLDGVDVGAPWPPTPMPATLIFSLGGTSPLRPNTPAGTIVTAAIAPAAATNSRRVTDACFFITDSDS